MKGATVKIQWKDPKKCYYGWHGVTLDPSSDCTEWTYMSFGEYDEDSDQDGFGVYDEDIFFYTSKNELKKALSDPQTFPDFVVLEVEYHLSVSEVLEND